MASRGPGGRRSPGDDAAEVAKVSLPRARALLGRILGLAKPEWRNLSVALVMLALGSVGSLAVPQAIRGLIDGALSGAGAPGAVDRAALLLLAVFVVQGLAGAVRFALVTISGERVVARLRKRLFEALLAQEVAFFDERRTGDLASTLVADTAVLQNAVSVNISMLLRNGAMVVGGLGMLLWTSLRLTLVMLAVVPAIAIGAVAYGRRVRKLSRAVQDAVGEGGSVAEESLSNLRTVRAFAAERAERARYDAAVDKSFALARTRTRLSSLFMAVATTSAFAAIALVFWYGGHQVLAGRLSAGELTSFLIYTLTVAFSLAALADLWADFMRAAGVSERVFAILDREPAIPLRGGRELPMVEGRVELESVTFRYPARPDAPVLRGLDLVLAPGEVVALVGHSGAGKSTVGALISRLYEVDGGAVRLDGVDVRELDPSWLRRQIGVVSQEPVLFSSTVRDNIRFARPDASDEEVVAAARAANADGFIRAFPDGYDTRVGERGVQLSGGQKQRVAIARAMLKDPAILILDEATSALDAESEELVREALARLRERGGAAGRGRRTTLIIAHRLSTIADADRVVVLEDGRVAQQGTHQRLMREEGLYKRLVEKQIALS